MSDSQCPEIFGGYTTVVDGKSVPIRCTQDRDDHRDHVFPPLGLHWHRGVGGALYISSRVSSSALAGIRNG